MQYINRIWCSNLERVLIVDRNISAEQVGLLYALKDDEEHLVIVDAKELALQLESLVLGSSVLAAKSMLFVFPGNGGQRVKEISSIHRGYRTATVFAKRIWAVGNDPFILAGEILTPRFLHPEVETIFVLDDVISSGQTATKIFARNVWKFPRATWYAGCLVSRGWKLPYYKDVFSALTVTNENTPGKKVPINTLGALIDDKEMAKSYTFRNLDNPERFLEVLELIRRYKTETA